MILYLDTSSILKLYLEEDGSADVAAAVAQATTLTTTRIAYAEARAGLARARRIRSINTEGYRVALAQFEERWTGVLNIDVSDDIVRNAGDLAERHDLRGYDAVHLASALFAKRESHSQIAFSTSDAALLAAAGREGLST